MGRFKVGDRVRVLRVHDVDDVAPYDSEVVGGHVGDGYQVRAQSPSSGWSAGGNDGDRRWHVYERDLELIAAGPIFHVYKGWREDLKRLATNVVYFRSPAGSESLASRLLAAFEPPEEPKCGKTLRHASGAAVMISTGKRVERANYCTGALMDAAEVLPVFCGLVDKHGGACAPAVDAELWR